MLAATYLICESDNELLNVKLGNKKWILRQALKNELPASILNGKKRGFNVPIDYWLKEPLSDYMCSILLENNKTNIDLFNKNILLPLLLRLIFLVMGSLSFLVTIETKW